MASSSPSHPDWSALPADLVQDIFFRLPKEDPLSPYRASLVCEGWRRAVADQDYVGLLRKRQEDAPLILGFLRAWNPAFIPTLGAAFTLLDVPDGFKWQVLDYRHCRALFLSKGAGTRELLVWEPITGCRWCVPLPHEARGSSYPGAAVVCSADGCDHRSCHGATFRIALVFCCKPSPIGVKDSPTWATWASTYSGDTGTWTEPIISVNEIPFYFGRHSSVLIRNCLLYFLADNGTILEFELTAGGTLSIVDPPDLDFEIEDRITLIVDHHGNLGIAEAYNDRFICLHSWEVVEDGQPLWLIGEELDASDLGLPSGHFLLLGYAEQLDTLFIGCNSGVYTVKLPATARKVCKEPQFFPLVPVVSPIVRFSPPVKRSKSSDNKEEEDLSLAN